MNRPPSNKGIVMAEREASMWRSRGYTDAEAVHMYCLYERDGNWIHLNAVVDLGDVHPSQPNDLAPPSAGWIARLGNWMKNA